MSGGGARSGGKGGGNPVIPNPNVPTSGATPVAGTGQTYEDVVAAGGGGINPNGMYTSNLGTLLNIGTGAFDPDSGFVGPATGATPNASGTLFNNVLNTAQSVATPAVVQEIVAGAPVTGAEPTTQPANSEGAGKTPSTGPINAVQDIRNVTSLPQGAAQALQTSALGTAQAMGFQPTGVSASGAFGRGYVPERAMAQAALSQGYNAATAGSQGYGVERAGSQGFDIERATSQGYTAQDAAAERAAAERAASQGYTGQNIAGVGPLQEDRVAAGQLATTNISQYLNPYIDQVVRANEADILRGAQIGLDRIGAEAQAAGAFGGSRQAIAEAEFGRGVAERLAQSSAALRQQGFQQAQQAATTDIASRMQANLANQRAGLQADTTTATLGQQAQALNQASQNQANQFTAAAANRAALQNAQLGTRAALQNAQLGTQVNLANQAAQNQAAQFAAQAANRAALQNALAQNQASQFGAQAANVAALQNAAAQNQASQFGAQAANVAALQNAAAQNRAMQFTADAANRAAMANADRGTQVALANAAAGNQALQFGADAANRASLANQSANLQAALANQSAAQAAANTRLAASGQMGDLGAQAFNTANTINQQVAQQGAIEQAAQQALIDAARGQFGQFARSPQDALQIALGAFAGSQTGQQTQTTSRQPGLFDYLTLGASII